MREGFKIPPVIMFEDFTHAFLSRPTTTPLPPQLPVSSSDKISGDETSMRRNDWIHVNFGERTCVGRYDM